ADRRHPETRRLRTRTRRPDRQSQRPRRRLLARHAQRLGLERALLHRPRVVLLDEPFTGLDDTSAAALVTRLRGLRAEGAIILLSTHDLDLVADLLDHVVILRAGRVVEDFETPAGKAEEQLRGRYRQALVVTDTTPTTVAVIEAPAAQTVASS